MAGLGSFLGAHLSWLLALRGRGGGGLLRHRPYLAVPYLAAYGGLNRYLWDRTGKDRVPVVDYSTALLAMARGTLARLGVKAAASVTVAEASGDDTQRLLATLVELAVAGVPVALAALTEDARLVSLPATTWPTWPASWLTTASSACRWWRRMAAWWAFSPAAT
jgi:hypothetical protein